MPSNYNNRKLDIFAPGDNYSFSLFCGKMCLLNIPYLIRATNNTD